MVTVRTSGLLAASVLLSSALLGCDARYPPRPEVWVDPPLPTYTPSGVIPPGTDEGAGEDGSLLESYGDRSPRDDAELDEWMLPFQAKTMVVELLIAAVKDDPERMKVLLSDNARWGAPDRREFLARPILTKDDPLGLDFLQAFRLATSRFGAKASFSCTPLQPGWQMLAASGAEPVWCSYASKDGLDLIGVRLITEHGRVKTDYVGFFEQRPPQALRVPIDRFGDPPPLTPYLKRQVSLTAPDLMPNGGSPVLAKPKPRAPEPPKPATEPTEAEADAAIPVKPAEAEPAKPEATPEPKPKPAKPEAPPEPKPKPAKPEATPDE